MKKLVIFICFILILGISFFFFMNKPKNYESEYKIDDYNVLEKYDRNTKYYHFIISKDDYKFTFVSNVSYSSKRKLIKKINEESQDEILCVEPEMENEEFHMICYKDNEYMDKYMAGIEEIPDNKKINKVANVEIYDKNYEYLIWNNKGYTSLSGEDKYNFLSKESYDNLLTYQFKNYIIVADYDQSRVFNKIYIYDNDSKKVDTWDLGVDISFDAYFMGEVDKYVYLFDKKNKVQYQLDIGAKKLEVTSDKDGAIYYDKGLTHKALDELAYKEIKFIYENKYNFILDGDSLYLRLFDTEEKIRITERKVDHIVYASEEEVYYLVDEKLYSYHINKGEKLLLVNFEWNFTYLNKIFIFD